MNAKGIFISEYQNSFTFLNNIDYIWQRVTDGMVTDAEYFAMLPEVKKVPIRGAVHNYRVHRGWKEQADNFLWTMDSCFQMIAGDYEDSPLTEQSAIDFWNFLHYLREESGMPIVFYSSAARIKNCLNAFNGVETVYGKMDWEAFPLWIARYHTGDEPNLVYDDETIHDTWHFWQPCCEVAGSDYGCGSLRVCEDVFNGDVQDLQDWVGGFEEEDFITDILEAHTALIEMNFQEIKSLQSLVMKLEDRTTMLKQEIDKLEQELNECIDDVQFNLNQEIFTIRHNENDIEGLNQELFGLEDKIDGLEGGHNHPRFFKWLGWMR